MDRTVLERDIQYLEDIQEIRNLIGRYSYLETAGRSEELMTLFAAKTPGVRMEVANSGVWEGGESGGLQRFIYRDHDTPRAGFLVVHALASPSIEVSGDGKTAKGMWFSPGHEAAPGEDGKPIVMWSWGKYAIDFVKEDGKWKFWHFHAYPIFKSEPLENWAEKNLVKPVAQVPDKVKTDRPPSYSWQYNPMAVTENVPVPPEPYETFDDKISY